MTDQERLDKAKEIESLFTQVFNTDEGRLVLKYIEAALHRDSNNISPVSDLYQIGVRDGRRDALYQIKKQIKG